MKFNFDSLQVSDKANTKTGGGGNKGQSFRFKFRNTGKKNAYTVSDKLWDECNFDDFGIKYANDENNNVFIIVVENEHANSLKKTSKGEKTKSFSSSVLDEMLSEAGLIDPSLEKVNQRLDFEAVDAEGTPSFVQAVYRIVADERTDAEAEQEDEQEVEVEDLD